MKYSVIEIAPPQESPARTTVKAFCRHSALFRVGTRVRTNANVHNGMRAPEYVEGVIDVIGETDNMFYVTGVWYDHDHNATEVFRWMISRDANEHEAWLELV